LSSRDAASWLHRADDRMARTGSPSSKELDDLRRESDQGLELLTI
jgi:hypothetical protein